MTAAPKPEKRQKPLKIGQKIFREWCAYHGAIVDVEMAAGLCKRIEAAIIEERRGAADMLATLRAAENAMDEAICGNHDELFMALIAVRDVIAKAEGRS